MYPDNNYYMGFYKKDFLIQMRCWTIATITIVSIYSDIPKYADEQIITLLKQHFSTMDKGLTYLGQSIYEDNNQRVFQLEIRSLEKKINEHLIYSFKALTKISTYARNPYKKLVVIIHLDKFEIPIIASSKFTCSKAFFMDNTMTEKQWRGECLLLKSL